ncbi:MAG: AAA family ATPase [Deferribacterales bacterium]
MNKNKLTENIFLNRSAKLSAIASQLHTKNIFLLTAGEGTGKTSFALDIGKNFFDRTIYYQITQKDKTPAHLCHNLYRAVQTMFPGFVSDDMEQAEMFGIAPLEAGNLLFSLMREYKKRTRIRTLIILDDFQMLSVIGVSYLAVMSTLSLAGGTLSFAISTHRTKGFSGTYSRINKEAYIIDENFLRLTHEEFRELAVKRLPDKIIFRSLDKMYEMTEGVISYASKILDMLSETDSDFSSELAQEACSGIFSSTIKGLMPDEYHYLLKLALLPSFNLQLLNLIDHTGIAEKLITRLNEKTVLIHRNRDEQYRFNRLFREWLRSEAMIRLAGSERQTFYDMAASYEEERKNLASVVEFLIAAESFDRLEDYLQKNFQHLILQENRGHLVDVFSEIPADVFRNRAWIPLAFGYALLSVSPEKTKDIFLHTLETFTAFGNHSGTIISACGMLSYYCGVAGDLSEGEKYFVRISSMMTETCSELEEPLKMVVCAAYGQGCMNFKSGHLAAEYLNKSLAIAEKYNAENFKLYLYSLLVSAYMTACEKKLAEKYCNLIFQKLTIIKQDSFLKLSLLSLLNHYLALTGQFHLMHLLMNMIRRKYRLHMEHSFRLSGFSNICELENAFSKGDIEYAKMIFGRLPDSNVKNLPEHLAAIFLSFKAITMAHECDDSAAAIAEIALKTRQSEANPFFTAFGEVSAGAAYTFSGNHKKAILHLTKAANPEKPSANDNAAACAHAYLSYLYNNIGDKMLAREHAIFCMRLMKKTGYTHLSALLPEVLLNACLYTVNEPSVSSFAADIARAKVDIAFDRNMRPIPVMHIKTLGSLSISIGQYKLDCSDISVQFRTMLAILLSSHGFSIDQEQMQVYLWPESSKENARRSLDNLLSRFRKLLTDTFIGIDPKNYITLQNGMLKMHNVNCDLERFNALIKSASESYTRGEYMFTAISVAEAETIYENRFFEGLTDIVPVEGKRSETDASFINMLRLMNCLWYFLPECFNPERLFDTFLNSFMHETDMVSLAYGYYARKGKIQKCRDILDRYTDFLNKEEYSKTEKAELIYLIKTSHIN